MGKGRIVSAHGEGRYTVELVEDRARAEHALSRAELLLAEVDEQIEVSQIDLDELQEEVDRNADLLQAAIQEYHNTAGNKDGSGSEKEAMQKASERFLASVNWRDEARARTNSLKLRRAGLQSRIDRISKLPSLRQVEAWCADYTEDLSGEVATAEVPGEVGEVLVRPGFQGGAAWNPARDGALQPAVAGTPSGVFYNLAMLPGWQKWRPTYRLGRIGSVDHDTDTCSLTLDSAYSSQQGLSVNARSYFSGVPIRYMECNAATFEDGDRVLVEFAGDPDSPAVIGFEAQPKQCCVCEARVLDSRILREGGEWLVRQNWTGLQLEHVCAEESAWRIVEVSTGEVLHSGSITPVPDTLDSGTLVGLPFSVIFSEKPKDGEYSELAHERTQAGSQSFDLSSYQNRSYPEYANGTWRLRETGYGIGYHSGSIDANGNLLGLPSEFVSGYNYEGNMSLEARPVDGYDEEEKLETEIYRLEIGCRDRATGELEWP